jgi:hypothetical protein
MCPKHLSVRYPNFGVHRPRIIGPIIGPINYNTLIFVTCCHMLSHDIAEIRSIRSESTLWQVLQSSPIMSPELNQICDHEHGQL